MTDKTDTQRRAWMHPPYKTERCACGKPISFTWDYKNEQWLTSHVCEFRPLEGQQPPSQQPSA